MRYRAISPSGDYQVGRTSIFLVNTPEATPDSVAFLTITDNKPAQATEKLFSGWMFASSPALSALDSSVYDVWVLACVTIPQASAPPSSR